MLQIVRRRRAATVLIAAAAVTASVLAVPTGAVASSGRYYTVAPTCAAAQPGRAHCFALQRVRAASARTPGAQRVQEAPASDSGPAGGFTPEVLAKAYGVNAATATTQTVGIVDAYDDPNALTDLNTFNLHYGLPPETTTSFRKVGQAGTTTLPAADTTGWSTEISLDLDAVRGLCHKCKIILVEANSSSFADLADATNTAVRLGATEVSNSYGGAENDPTDPATPTIAAAYNHPGVVVTASTGDDGYYDWDNVNYRFGTKTPPAGTPTSASSVASLPAAYNTVVAVGGTTLQLNDDGTRSGESVWNSNGIGDSTGISAAEPQGATGGGCSTLYTAQKWQSSVAGYDKTACGTKRLTGDVSALADPYTGFDIYDSYEIPDTYSCRNGCWATFGGTSLASPLIAAMWALAGGAGGVTYPSLSLYGHLASSSTAQYDVTVGGNGICGGQSRAGCASTFGGPPNSTTIGAVDCAWQGTTKTPSVGTRACDAATGYDGPSGVGTPRGLTMFKALAPTARITAPATITHAHAAKFSGRTSTDPFPGGTVSKYRWTFGDKGTSTSSTPAHTYAKKGSYTVSLTVTDSYARSATVTRKVTVK